MNGEAATGSGAAAIGDPCLVKAEAGEPRFTLLARDEDGFFALAEWCRRRLGRIGAGLKPAGDLAQVEDALNILARFSAWRAAHRRRPEPRPESVDDMLRALGGLRGEVARCRLALMAPPRVGATHTGPEETDG